MEFERLLALVGAEPVFETSLLLAGHVTRADVQRQLSRWSRAVAPFLDASADPKLLSFENVMRVLR